MTGYLFVYGSLRKGHAPPAIAETADKLEFVAEAFVYGKIYKLGNYLGLILGGEEKIFGQILELPDDEEILENLDEYEGFAPNDPQESLYVRKETNAYFDETHLKVWVYEYNRDLPKV